MVFFTSDHEDQLYSKIQSTNYSDKFSIFVFEELIPYLDVINPKICLKVSSKGFHLLTKHPGVKQPYKSLFISVNFYKYNPRFFFYYEILGNESLEAYDKRFGSKILEKFKLDDLWKSLIKDSYEQRIQ